MSAMQSNSTAARATAPTSPMLHPLRSSLFNETFRAKIGHFAIGHSKGRAKSGHFGT